MEKVSTLGAIATLLILAGGPVGHGVRASEDKASLLSLRKGTASALHIQRSANDVPGRVLIPNVPFVSWADAAHIEIHDQFLNPSTVSALATVLKYWDQSVNLLKEADKAFP